MTVLTTIQVSGQINASGSGTAVFSVPTTGYAIATCWTNTGTATMTINGQSVTQTFTITTTPVTFYFPSGCNVNLLGAGNLSGVIFNNVS